MKTGIPLPLLRWRGFTLQMFLLIFLPLSVLLLVISFASQSLHHQEMRSLVGDRDLRVVRTAALGISNGIARREAALAALASQLTPEGAQGIDQAAQDHGFDGGLALFDGSGALVAASNGAAVEIRDLSQAQKAASQGGLPTAAAGAARLSQPIQAADGRWLVIGYVTASGNETLVGAFTPAGLARESLAGIASTQTSLLLISTRGELLYQSGHLMLDMPVLERPGVADALRGDSGVNYTAMNMGIPGDSTSENVIAFAPVTPAGWGIILQEPWEQGASPLLAATQSAPLILVPVLMLALAALWFGARQIIQPLQALEGRAELLASGDFEAIHQPVGGISEIRHLQGELIEMSGRLQSAQDALHGYIGSLTAGVETERRSLARELHDDTLQSLVALNQQAQLTLMHTTDEAQRQALLDLQERVGQTIASLRRAIGGLRPIYLEDLGLAAALGMLARETDHPGSAEITFTQRGEEKRLPPAAELALYRIAQEALNNARSHARASRIQISLAFGADVRLSIADDGQGFPIPEDPNAFARLGHYGLMGMQERADITGLDLHIESAPGEGTQVNVSCKPGNC